jgi:glutaredoxin
LKDCIKNQSKIIPTLISAFNFKSDRIVETKIISSFELPNISNDHLLVDFSLDRKQWVFGYINEIKRNTSLIGVYIYNLKGERVFQNSDTLKIPRDYLIWDGGSLSDSAKFVGTILANLPREFGSKSTKNQELHLCAFSEKVSDIFKLNLHNGTYMHSILTVDPIKQDWHISGLYSNANGMDVIGCFDQVISSVNFPQKNYFDYEFQQSTIDQILEIKNNKRKELPRNLYLRRLIFNANGNKLFLLEQFNELRQLETYYVNGIPQTATKISYHYGDIFGLFMNKEFALDGCIVIKKDQSATISNAYLLGFGSSVCKDGIHIVFNDDIARKNQILDYCIQPNFQIVKKVIIYSRSGCHLCEIAIDRIKSIMGELKFELDIKLIDDDLKLQEEYGEQVPVILIEDKVHDYWRVDLERFTKAIKA